MKDLYQVLRQKELDVERLRQEIEALRVVTPLLSEDSETENNGKAPRLAASAQPRRTGSGD